jgi:hypothetical protein
LSYLRNQQYNQAAEVVIAGIKQDLDTKPLTQGAVSVRLYDLLAAIVARHGLNQYHATLIDLATKAEELSATQKLGPRAERRRRKKPVSGPPDASEVNRPAVEVRPAGNAVRAVQETAGTPRTRAGLFTTRLKNWTNKKSKWWVRLTNQTFPLTWAMNQPPDTSQNKNSVYRVRL